MRRSLVRVMAATLLAASCGVAAVSSTEPAVAQTSAPVLTTVLAGNSAATQTCRVSTVDLTTGAVTPLGPAIPGLACPIDYAPAPDGRMLGVTASAAGDSQLVVVDTATGVQTPIGNLGLAVTSISGLEFDAAGTLWMYAATDEPDCLSASCLYRIDPIAGSATRVADAFGPETVALTLGLTRTCVDPLYTAYFDPGLPAEAQMPSTENPSPEAIAAPEPGDGDVSATAADFGIAPFDGSEVDPAQTNVSVLATVDTANGQLGERPTTFGSTTIATGLVFTADGTLWAIAANSNSAPSEWFTGTVDPTTGVFTRVATLGITARTQIAYGLGTDALVCSITIEPTFTG